MKLINRSKSNSSINWKSNIIDSQDIEKTALRYKELVLKNGTKAFNEINEELNLPKVKSFKVKKSEINKAENSIADDLKQAILNSANNIKIICENEKKEFGFIIYRNYERNIYLERI